MSWTENRTKNLFLAVLIIFSLLFISRFSSAKPLTLKLVFETTIDHSYGRGGLAFKEYVEKKTNNGIVVELHGAGQLGKSGEDIQQGVMLGTIECGITSTPIALLNPIQKIFDLPFLFPTRQDAWATLDGPVGQKVASKLESKGVKTLSYWEDGFRAVTNNVRPINRLEDFEGLKIRVPYSPQRIETFKLLGAKPTAMPFGEVFSALEQGVIDGQENPLAVVSKTSFYDVQKYVSITNHVYSPATLLINLNFWNRLSKEQQDIVAEGARIGQKVCRDFNASSDLFLLDELKEKGMEVSLVAPEEIKRMNDKLKPIWDLFVSEEGEEAKELLDEVVLFLSLTH